MLRFLNKLCWPLVITILLWGGNFIALKLAYRQITPETLYVVRYSLMTATLWVTCGLSKVPIQIHKGDFWRVFYFGFVSMGLYLFIFVLGMKYASPAEGALIIALSPLMTAIGGFFIGEHPYSLRVILGGIVAVGGVSLVVLGPGSGGFGSHLGGDLLVLISAVLWAHQTLLSKPLLARYSAMQLMALRTIGALPVSLFFLPQALGTPWSKVNAVTWLSVVYVATLSGVLAFTLFYYGVKLIGASKTTTYQYFTPIVTVILAFLILGSPITSAQIFGTAIVIGGLAVARQGDAPSQHREAVSASNEPSQVTS